MKIKLMTKIICAGFLILCSFALNYAASPARNINYEITPRLGADQSKIEIIVSFKGDRSGSTKIRLPLEFAGQSDLYRCVTNLHMLTPGAQLAGTDKPDIKIVTHPPGEEIRIQYELVQDWQGMPQAGGATMRAGGGYRPIIQKDYFHFLGSGGWILPDITDDAEVKVGLNWKNLPQNYALANSFGTNKSEQKFESNVENFKSAVFVGGDYQITQKTVKGQPIYIASRGQWKFKNEELAELTEKIIGADREFWNDYRHPYFLVTLLPLESDPNSRSIGGTGLTNSFAMFVTTNTELENLKFLISHEYFHNWNTNSFGGMKDPEQLIYWFSEGFTDYYTYRLLLRAGLIDLDKYLAQYNEFLTDYYLSPVRNEDNRRILRDFFSDPAVQKLPYRRGFLLATKWNDVISRQSGGRLSLNDVMRKIFQDARRGRFKKLSKEYLIPILSKYAEYDFAADVEKYVERGETIDNFAGVLGPCVQAFEEKKGQFEIGFDFEAVRKNKMTAGVIAGSPAYDAGLRNGQKVIGSSVYFGQLDKPVEITVEENGQPKKISYLPEGKEKVSYPQFKLKDNLPAKERTDCLKSAALFQ